MGTVLRGGHSYLELFLDCACGGLAQRAAEVHEGEEVPAGRVSH